MNFISKIIKIIKRNWLKCKLKKGYKAKAKLNLEICEDFKYVNRENLD